MGAAPLRDTVMEVCLQGVTRPSPFRIRTTVIMRLALLTSPPRRVGGHDSQVRVQLLAPHFPQLHVILSELHVILGVHTMGEADRIRPCWGASFGSAATWESLLLL